MGLKEGGLRGSLRNVSAGVSAIPDSVVVRYDASELELSDGDVVDSWPDSSDNQFGLTGTSEPIYREDQINGLPTVHFDGSDNRLEEDSFSQQQPCAVSAVVRTNDTGNSQYISDSNGNRQIAAIVDGGDTQSGPGAFAGSWLDGGSDPGTNYRVISWIFDEGSSEVRIDGGTDISGNAGGDPADDGIVIGGGSGNATSYLDGEIAEYLRVDDITDVPDAEDYLSSKWGV